MALFVVYGFDTAGHLRRGDARREPPGAARHPVGDLAVRHRRRDLPAGCHAVLQGRRGSGGDRPGVRLPDRRYDPREPAANAHRRRSRSGAVPRRDPDRRVRLHPRDPGRDGPAHVLDGPRPTAARSVGCGRTSARPSRRPSYASIAVGLLAAVPILLTGALGSIYLAIARHRHDLPRLLPVQPRRPRGAPQGLAAQGRVVQARQLGHDPQHPRPDLGRRDDHQHRPLDRPACSGPSATTLRETWSNPFIDTFITFGGQPIAGLPHWPVFETLVGLIVGSGADLLPRRPAWSRGSRSRPTSRPARRSSA